ncbi:MAG TPA: WbqC family protein, partial [Draconibacterium sp.]|nr:WbqC family protein [Draconibacterium sp.]
EKVPEGTVNLRESISPKIKTQSDDDLQPVQYTQVFSDKLGFVPNISILDLLFNEGPNSYSVLELDINNR